jgi:hypothetical protein
MLEPLLAIFGSYAACIALVHLVYRIKHPDASARETWVLITFNHQHKIEWMLRFLLFVSWLKGRSIDLVVVDRGSNDDTMKIVERFARSVPFTWTVVRSEEEVARMIGALEQTGLRVFDLEQTDPAPTALQYL